MSYWYWRALKTDMDIEHGVTQRFDLPEKGHLSALMMKLHVTSAADLNNYNDPYPMQRMDLRVVGNGNVELIDLRGRQLQALNYWDDGKMPMDFVFCTSGSGTDQYAYIPFGRYIGDPKYGLILGNFAAGVQVEESDTFSDSYYTSGSSKLTVYGLFRKNPEAGLFSGGFLRKRQVLNKDTASETQYAVKLPTRNKLRQISLFTEPDLGTDDYLPETGPFTNLNKVWLGIKSREEYLLDNLDVSLYARYIHQMYKREPYTSIFTETSAGTDRTVDTMIYERQDSMAISNYGATAYGVTLKNTTMWERIEIPYGWDADGTLTAVNCYLRSKGICYHGHVPMLMQHPLGDEEGWLDAYDLADVYIEFTEGASTGNIYVVLDELQKTYPS